MAENTTESSLVPPVATKLEASTSTISAEATGQLLYEQVPWYRRHGFNAILTTIGLFIPLVIAIPFFIMVSGPIYQDNYDKFGVIKKWGVVQKLGVVITLLLQILMIYVMVMLQAQFSRYQTQSVQNFDVTTMTKQLEMYQELLQEVK